MIITLTVTICLITDVLSIKHKQKYHINTVIKSKYNTNSFKGRLG